MLHSILKSPGISGSGSGGWCTVQTTLGQFGGKFGRERCCLEVVGGAGPWIGGVFGQLSGSNMFITSSSLLIEGAREGARKLGGSAAGLGAAAVGKNGIGIEEEG